MKRRYQEHPKYLRSYQAFLNEDYDEAGRLLEELQKEMPGRAACLNDLGICYYLAGNRSGSREILHRAADLLGKKSAPHINLSYIFDRGRFQPPEGGLSAHEYRIPDGKTDFSQTFVSIIILEYKNTDLTLNCLRTLQAVRIRVPHEVILIDNSEGDPACDYARMSGKKDLVYRKNVMNVGFAKGCNQGAGLAKGEFLYFVNNDTRFQENCVEELARILLLDKKVGIVGSRLLYDDGTIQHAGIVFDHLSGNPKHRRQFSLADDPTANIPLQMQAVTGASMMTRRDLFVQGGGFSEEYINGFEDVDFCLRVILLGHKVIYNPRSVLWHLESMSGDRSVYEKANGQRFHSIWSDSIKRDELQYLTTSENFLLSYSDNPERMKRHEKIYALCSHLDQKHPDILSLIPLHCVEIYKHYRLRKFCGSLFDFMIREDHLEGAMAIYRYFLLRQFHRTKYILHMRRVIHQHLSRR